LRGELELEIEIEIEIGSVVGLTIDDGISCVLFLVVPSPTLSNPLQHFRTLSNTFEPSLTLSNTFEPPKSPKTTRRIWKDDNNDDDSDEDHNESEDTPRRKSSSGSISRQSPRRKSRKTKLNKFMKEMPTVRLPKNISAMKNRKKFKKKEIDDLPHKTVKIFKASSIDGQFGGIDIECLNKAKKYVCGSENWQERCERLGGGEFEDDLEPRTVFSAIISKSNDDVRQEVFVMQLIHFYQSVFKSEGLPIYLKPYRILSTSKTTGLIELLRDATSIDGLKKSDNYPAGGLRAYFELVYGSPDSESFKIAQNNFMTSLVGYSLCSYLIGLKDRHNGNIMIDTHGHLIFIDFGFAMGMKPGHEWGFERAPFKFTKEYLDVMGGLNSDCFSQFKKLFVAGFKAARASSQLACGLVEIMMFQSQYPCFTGRRYGKDIGLYRFQRRLMLHQPEEKIDALAEGLIWSSIDNVGTVWYDKFQLATNGIAP